MTPIQIKPYNDNEFRISIDVPVGAELEVARELAREMSGEAFINLEEFPYLYLTSGITEAMDWVLPRHRVRMWSDDYRYAKFYERSGRQDLHYLTYPYAATGKFGVIPNDLPVFLDCAYMFASHMRHANRTVPKHVQYIAFSLSKSHNVADYRIGWLFTREPLQPQHVVQYDYGYAPHRHADVLTYASNYPPNHLYLQFKHYLSNLYAKHGLTEGDTNLFALDKQGSRVPYYALPPTV